MCGRISRTSPREAIAAEFGVSRFVNVDFRPLYNVAPSQNVETIICVDDEKRLGPMRWGFVPTAAKDPKLARSTRAPRRLPQEGRTFSLTRNSCRTLSSALARVPIELRSTRLAIRPCSPLGERRSEPSAEQEDTP
jgi:putative SOS response-associated peptidase YedK